VNPNRTKKRFHCGRMVPRRAPAAKLEGSESTFSFLSL
jgi:hypothetical protein